MSEPPLPGVTREMLEPVLQRTATAEFAIARGRLLDTAFQAEHAITTVVAAYLGRRIRTVVYLAESVIGPQSVNQRLRYLDEIMADEGWHDDFPFVMPVLRKLFELRNSLAHSYGGFPERDGDDWMFSRWTHRRGKSVEVKLALGRIRGLLNSANYVIRHDMDLLWIRSIPEEFWRARDF